MAESKFKTKKGVKKIRVRGLSPLLKGVKVKRKKKRKKKSGYA